MPSSIQEVKMGRVIWLSPAGPDDPIYKEGLTVFTPYTARPPRTPKPLAKKSQDDTDTRPAPSGQRVPTNRPVR